MDTTGRNSRIIEAVLRGEHSRFQEIVDEFESAVRRVVGGRISDRSAREDVIQETWCRAFTKLATLASPERLGSWLQGIARRCAADHHRGRVEAGLGDAGTTVARAGPGGLWVWEEVDALSPALGEILRLRYREGLSYDELASRLNLKRTTVRGRLYEARRALRHRVLHRTTEHEAD